MQLILEANDAFFTWLWRASWQASVVIALVLVTQWLLRDRLAPRWRHALWALVIIRLALPVSFESHLSLFNWFDAMARSPATASVENDLPTGFESGTEPALPFASAATHAGIPWSVLWWLWLAGAATLLAYLLASTFLLGRRIRRERPLTDGAVLDLLEDCKQEMGVRTPLTLVETPGLASPSLFGFIRPRLLLPAGLTRSFSLAELRYVFLHELGHIKRGDIAMNWLTVLPLILHWFNPFVWYAFNRMRVDGEVACDALALSRAREGEKDSYGQTILNLVERFSRPAVAPGLVGILENHNQMKRRISMIAQFKKSSNWSWLAMSVFACLALVTLTDARSAQDGKESSGGSGSADPQGPPNIVATSPKVGQTEVDPSIKEITVTFDRDMGAGFSWTGSGPDHPKGPEGMKPYWVKKRTCVLPVKLETARYYRVGINSTSYQNFRSAAGVPARPSAIYFTTKGASEELKRKASKPQIVTINPAIGAQDVDPNLKELRITFNVPMGGGFSWTGGGENFPTIPEGKKPFWTEDHKTCVLPVELKPGWNYSLGLNSPSHKNFQSAGGVPLDPVAYSFRTK